MKVYSQITAECPVCAKSHQVLLPLPKQPVLRVMVCPLLPWDVLYLDKMVADQPLREIIKANVFGGMK